MKEKGRSRALHKKPYGLCKRFLAAMIAAVMVTTNIGTDLTTAYAAESSDSVTFEMSERGGHQRSDSHLIGGQFFVFHRIEFPSVKNLQGICARV